MRRPRAIAAAPQEQPVPPRPPVAVKGRGEGLHIVIAEGDPQAIEQSLRDQLERRAGAFFAGAAVALELPPGRLDLALAVRLQAVVEGAGMEVIAVERQSGRPAGRPHTDPHTDPHAASSAATGTGPAPALVVSGTIRSGQRIEHDGTIIVVGDVNPGGAVVAGGSVVVWGRLRGTVEAGLSDDGEGSVVCALDLAPTQLRIGRALARAPEDPNRTPVPEIARAVGGQIVVEG
jgi:septum site-determining protein MinC